MGGGRFRYWARSEKQMTGSCICGAVRVTIDAKPPFIHDCNCSLCRKSGAAWGYFATSCVSVMGETLPFMRRDKDTPIVAVHACRACAATTHFALTTAYKGQNPLVDLLGVNMRLFDPDELQGVEVRYPDGKAWSGQGPYGYRREAMAIGESARW